MNALKLIEWYQANKRDLPWRQNHDPYAIYVSEIMLQQTQVTTVIDYYQRFMQVLPTINDLAGASDETLYKLWEGLGYYSRVRNMKTCAKQIVENHHGKFPNTIEALSALKGIGPYTASAIASIAFHQKTPAIDGNLSRVGSRFYGLDDNIMLEATKKKIYDLLLIPIQEVDGGLFNQALMDLGAHICTPKHPSCDKCPLNEACIAKKQHLQEVLPIKLKKLKKSEKHYMTLIIHLPNQRYQLELRQEGLLSGLYGFIQEEVESIHSLEDIYQDKYHTPLLIQRYLGDVKHVFTHQTWYMHVYEAYSDYPIGYSEAELEKLAISTAHRKVLQLYEKS